MKKALVVLSVLVLLATVSTSAFAERWGKPGANLAKGQSSIGLEYSYIEKTVDYSPPASVVLPVPGLYGEHQVAINQLLVRVGYGLTEQLEAFVKLGGTSTAVEDAFLDSTINLAHDMQGDLEFTIIGGLDATLLQSGDFRLGANGQMGFYTLDDTDAFGPGLTQAVSGNVFTFEGALLASYTLGKFTPYGGVCMFFSDADTSYQIVTAGGFPVVTIPIDTNQEEWFGGVCGLSCQVLDNVRVGVELTGVAEGVGVSTGVTVAL